jgi:hypothetical protein
MRINVPTELLKGLLKCILDQFKDLSLLTTAADWKMVARHLRDGAELAEKIAERAGN